MDLKGIFTSNHTTMPQWKNKKGENEFENMLNNLATIGKKITILKKKADTMKLPDGSGATTMTVPDSSEKQTKEETVSPASHYDATPRPLGEVFSRRSMLSDQAIFKAKEIVGKKLQDASIPAGEIYLLKTDITRYAGDGMPATGRISFQMPFQTPQGDSRTIYADVDIVLGSLMPPSHFTDGLNTKYSFDNNGMNELLKGRDFEVLQNPKVQPETVFFESPGHLAGRGGMCITRQGQIPDDPKKQLTELMPGTDLANLIRELEDFGKKAKEHADVIKKAQKKLEELVRTSPETAEIKHEEGEIKKIKVQEKDLLSRIASAMEKIENKAVKYVGELWKIDSKMKASPQPTPTAIAGRLIEELKAQVPTIKNIMDSLWQNDFLRTVTEITSLVKEVPGQEPKSWEVSKEEVKPTVTYTPPKKEEEASVRDYFRKCAVGGGISKYFEDIFGALDKIEVAIEETKSQMGKK